MKTFNSFLTKKDRENKDHLYVLGYVLEKAGFKITNKLNDEEPYIYVHKPSSFDPLIEQLSFGGVRIYTRGKDTVCYRSQNKVETEPFGTARQLNVNEMFKDLIDEKDKKFIGQRIIFYIIQELKDFFIKSAKAEREEAHYGKDRHPWRSQPTNVYLTKTTYVARQNTIVLKIVAASFNQTLHSNGMSKICKKITIGKWVR